MYFDLNRTTLPALRLAVLSTLLLGLTACVSSVAEPTKQNRLPTVQLHLADTQITAELANTAQSRQTGLMYRESLKKNEGMLFVFKRSERQCMWMKNTLIDLDVAFIDEAGVVLNVAQMKAGTEDIHCSEGNAKLALEMNLNWFSKMGITEGSKTDLQKEPTPIATGAGLN